MTELNTFVYDVLYRWVNVLACEPPLRKTQIAEKFRNGVLPLKILECVCGGELNVLQ